MLTSLLHAPEFPLLLLATGIALVSGALGLWLTSARRGALRFVPFGAGLLVGISAFGVLPELSEQFGRLQAAGLLLGGFGVLWFIGRYIYPVCPSCAHTHDHEHCVVTLHGFALPLVTAAVLHSFLDGLSIAASQQEGTGGLGVAVFLGVALHKVPEGLAYGAILKAALKSRLGAFGWCIVTQAPTLAGGVVQLWLAPQLGAHWIGYPLAFAGGSFLYLGFHAVHSEWRRRGPVPAFVPALTGAAGAAALHQGLRLFLH